MKTLLIQYSNGKEVRAEVSDKATVTFGGLIPGAKVDGGSNRTALRVYEGKVQLGVFTGVESFRFLDSISVLEKRTQSAVKSIIVEEHGIQKHKTVNVQTEEWVNPDEVKPENSIKKTSDDLFNTLQIEVSK